MTVLVLIATHIIAVAFGAWAYRWAVKHDPEMLEDVADKVRDVGRRLGD